MDTPRSAAPLHRPDGEHRSLDFGGYRERLRELIREHPASSLVVAVLAGYLVGRLVRA